MAECGDLVLVVEGFRMLVGEDNAGHIRGKIRGYQRCKPVLVQHGLRPHKREGGGFHGGHVVFEGACGKSLDIELRPACIRFSHLDRFVEIALEGFLQLGAGISNPGKDGCVLDPGKRIVKGDDGVPLFHYPDIKALCRKGLDRTDEQKGGQGQYQ